jgi:hypothetical protein
MIFFICPFCLPFLETVHFMGGGGGVTTAITKHAGQPPLTPLHSLPKKMFLHKEKLSFIHAYTVL